MSCKKLMCKYKFDGKSLSDKSITRKWLKINHPDKGGTINSDDFNNILECYQNNEFCNLASPTNNQTNNQKNKSTKYPKYKSTFRATRARIFSCMRKTANFSKIVGYHKFDKSIYDPNKLNLDLAEASPKMMQLLNNIKELDAQDEINHNKKFKHFIFSDVKEGGYGAKIIASAFQANGYNNIIKAKKGKKQKLNLYLDIQNSNYKNFALLCSNSIYDATFNEKIKREVLKTFNERPANINGKNVRLIIFDSGFKEGIDLFDVKYVHIFEPSLTIADLKQTIGRATRTCGQKGLPFQENIGWPLYVYNYYLTVPEIVSSSLYTNKALLYDEEEPKDEDVVLFKNMEKYNDATLNYSTFDKAMNSLSEQLYNLAPMLAVDYELTQNMHNVSDLNNEFMDNEVYLMRGGANKYKNPNAKSKFFKIDYIKCHGKCGKKNTNDIPIGIDFMIYVYKKYKHPSKLLLGNKSNRRQLLCDYMKNLDNKFCSQLNFEWAKRYTKIPDIIENTKNLQSMKKELLALELKINDDADVDNKIYPLVLYKGKKHNQSYKLITKSINSNQSSRKHKFSKLNFTKMRDYIKKTYYVKEFIWEKMVIENKCLPNANANANANSASQIAFNPTQKFITHYFTPESPYKGLLLWHSVGTGKTCTGVATATTSFEKQGYSILWVTRTTLKSDVWKNIFDQICHTIILDEIEKGLIIPENINERKKLLSKSWLEPMSYKQFSNLLAGKNKIYDTLLERNGSTDILKKTLIIIDEAHKLYGGDLKASERPDTDVMENLISNSYKVSGFDSCKLLIMTATPFTNSPLELFSLINLFIEHKSDKITTNKEEFKKQYMTSENILSTNGVKLLANKLTGLISYLNREKDPTQFAQPIMINVPILMTHIETEELRDAIYLNKKFDKVAGDVAEQIIVLKEKIKNMKTDYKTRKAKLTETKSSYSKEEFTNLNNDLKVLLKNIKDLEEELNNYKDTKYESETKIKELKDKVKKIKQSLLQEYILYTKCAHLNYNNKKNNGTRKSYKLMK
jgi:superfamily II DNA or RNA helicase